VKTLEMPAVVKTARMQQHDGPFLPLDPTQQAAREKELSPVVLEIGPLYEAWL
jgi:hypothetical protein